MEIKSSASSLPRDVYIQAQVQSAKQERISQAMTMQASRIQQDLSNLLLLISSKGRRTVKAKGNLMDHRG